MTRQAGAVEQGFDALQQRRNAARMEEVLHQVFPARAHVGDERRAARDGVEIRRRKPNAEPSGDGDEVHDGVGRSAHRHQGDDRVVEGGAGQDARRAQVFAHHLDDALAAHLGDGAAARVGRRNRGASRQAHPEHFGETRHGGRSAHHHAMSGAAGDGALDLA